MAETGEGVSGAGGREEGYFSVDIAPIFTKFLGYVLHIPLEGS